MKFSSEEYERMAEGAIDAYDSAHHNAIRSELLACAQVYATLCLAAATVEAAAMPEPEKVPITDPRIFGARELKSLACTQYDAVRPPNHAACKMLGCECECHVE